MPSMPSLKKGANGPDKDVCYVEPSKFEKGASSNPAKTPDTVWKMVKPPGHLGGSNPPIVTARKLEIVRAQLSGKLKTKDERSLGLETSDIYSTTKISRRTKF